ncbi:MAG: hypothetical protein WAV46_01595 [Candidatus Moraniibacteriota bacterium]
MLVFIISGFFQSLIAILQFIEQKSLGLSILEESILSPASPGVAKVVIGSEIFIRSYGLFPHPNILGGFLAVSLLMTIVYPLLFTSQLFHVEQSNSMKNVPRGTFLSFISRCMGKCSTWNTSRSHLAKMFHVEQSRSLFLYRMIIFFQSAALLFSFSKTAIAGFIIGLVLAIFGMKKMFHVEQSNSMKNVPRGTLIDLEPDTVQKCSTWNKLSARFNKMGILFHVEHWIIMFGIVLTVLVFASVNLKLFIVQPITERLFYMRSLRVLWQEYAFEGLGIGQFVYRIQDLFSEPLLSWQFQPIHNVFLLVFSEIGVIGLGLFLWFYIYVFLKNNQNVPRGTNQQKGSQCSTWNIGNKIRGMFHVEQFSGVQFRGESKGGRKVIAAYLLRSLLVVVVIAMLFDHYFWDIQQGELVLWIILALAVSESGY